MTTNPERTRNSFSQSSKFCIHVTSAAILLLWMILTIGCSSSDGRIRIAREPRFVHDQNDPLPVVEEHYPAEFADQVESIRDACDARGFFIAGFDMLLEYTGSDGALSDSERFVQSITRHERVFATVHNCGDTLNENRIRILEMFEPGENWDVITFHSCNESIMTIVFSGELGIIDLDDLEDRLSDRLLNWLQDPDAHVLILGSQNIATGEVTPEVGFTRADFDHADAEARGKATVRWNATYGYDGCNGAGARTTQCGTNAIHCLQIRTEDSKRVFNRVFQRP